MKLKELYKVYRKWFQIEDTNRIDVVLATALSQKLKDDPLWLILVGPSGDMKSGQLTALLNYKPVQPIHNLTSKALVNGYRDKDKYPDLAPSLHDKIVIFPDMAQLLKLPTNEKGEVWGQLRDLYDGLAGKVSGQGANKRYSGLFVTLLGASTNAIDGQLLIHQDLGTRELIYRVYGSENKEKVMNKCLDNVNQKKEMDKEMKTITNNFLENAVIKDIKLSEDVITKLKEIAIYTTQMRATGEFDRNSELRGKVYPEEPTRIIKQLKRMFICLMSLDEYYREDKALEIIKHVARSSAFQNRILIMDYLWKHHKLTSKSIYEISTALKLGRSTIKRECLILENIGLIGCDRKEELNDRVRYNWYAISDPSTFVGNTILPKK